MNFRFSERSLATQMALVFGVLTTLLALLLSFSFGEMLRGRIRDDAGAALRVVAHSVSRQLEVQLRTRVEQVAVLARSPGLWDQGLAAPGVAQLLGRMQAIASENQWVGAVDADGLVRTATGGLLQGVSVREQPWFQAGLKGPHVGEVKPLPAQPAPGAGDQAEPPRFVDLSAPILAGGQVRGVLGVHIGWDWAENVIAPALPPEVLAAGRELFVFDRAGRLIFARSAQSPESLQAAVQGLQAPRGQDGDSTGEWRWDDGADYLTSVATLRSGLPATDLGWRVVVRQPVTLAYSSVDEATRTVRMIGAIATLLASLLAYRAARRLSRNLHGIALAARRVEAGAPGAGMPVFGGSSEVTALSSALRNMTVQLLASNSRMEQQVRLRTRELLTANAALDRQARSDPLTGVLNRRGLEERLRLAVASARRGARPLAVAMVDADYFKRINDGFGHEVGDAVLRRLAETLRSRLRASDAVARLGGEEFIAVLPDTDLAGAMALAESLRAAVEGHEDSVYGSITVSIGVAVASGADIDAAGLLRRADEALYRAKEAGRNRVSAAA